MTIATEHRVVPWVTKWSAEEIDPTQHHLQFDQTGQLRLVFTDEQPSDRFLAGSLRTSHGEPMPGSDVLWYREGRDRSGTPLFAQVNGRRQANCILSSRCQVCGGKIRRTEHGLPWLFSEAQLLRVQTFQMTDNPPTCRECMPKALRLCPHLRTGGARAFYVGRHFPVGVSGDLYSEEGGGMPERGAALFGTTDITRILAKKLLAGLQGLVEFEVPA